MIICKDCGNELMNDSRLERNNQPKYWCKGCNRFEEGYVLQLGEKVVILKGKKVIKTKQGKIKDWIGLGKNL